MIINCEGCKQDFESARKKRFCTSECRDKSYLKNHPSVVKVCPGCSTEFSTSKPDKKWCSKKCSDKIWSKNPNKKASVREWFKMNPEKKRQYGRTKYLNKKDKTPPSKPIYINTCKVTGKTFVSRRRGVRYSPEGIVIRRRMQNYPSYRWPKSEHACKECDKIFIGTPQASYCSKECSKKHNKRIARMVEKVKERGCSVIVDRLDPIVVFNKYDWHCAVCASETPRHLLGTMEDKAPTIDHITPISAGGAHSYLNTQLLCRECNMAKGAMVDPPKEIIQLITVNNQLNKQIYVTEQQLTRST